MSIITLLIVVPWQFTLTSFAFTTSEVECKILLNVAGGCCGLTIPLPTPPTRPARCDDRQVVRKTNTSRTYGRT